MESNARHSLNCFLVFIIFPKRIYKDNMLQTFSYITQYRVLRIWLNKIRPSLTYYFSVIHIIDSVHTGIKRNQSNTEADIRQDCHLILAIIINTALN